MSTVDESTGTPPAGGVAPPPEIGVSPEETADPPPGPGESVPVRSGGGRRRAGTWVMVVAAVVGAASVATVAGFGVFSGGSTGTPAASQLPPATAEVARTTMVRTESFDGTLGYGQATTVSAFGGDGQADGPAGIITWRPGIGETITRGEPVYGVNAEPVTLLYGDLPFFRTLTTGTRGADVEQLEDNLAELGYEGFTVDSEFTSATATAVAQWQDDLGLAVTGRFDPAHAVVAPGQIRIAEQLAPLGAAASGALLTYTATDRVVTVEMAVADRRHVTEQMPVTVTLPDDTPVEGTIADVGTASSAGESGEGTGQPQQNQSVTIEVMITMDDPESLGDWDTAPVQVAVEVERREGILAVPVQALVALAEGGYGVQVVDGDQTSYLPVDTGLFADGLVEVTGDGLTSGVLVGVPS